MYYLFKEGTKKYVLEASKSVMELYIETVCMQESKKIDYILRKGFFVYNYNLYFVSKDKDFDSTTKINIPNILKDEKIHYFMTLNSAAKFLDISPSSLLNRVRNEGNKLYDDGSRCKTISGSYPEIKIVTKEVLIKDIETGEEGTFDNVELAAIKLKVGTRGLQLSIVNECQPLYEFKYLVKSKDDKPFKEIPNTLMYDNIKLISKVVVVVDRNIKRVSICRSVKEVVQITNMKEGTINKTKGGNYCASFTIETYPNFLKNQGALEKRLRVDLLARLKNRDITFHDY